jgi:mono/diheme cytochrome c family protein
MASGQGSKKSFLFMCFAAVVAFSLVMTFAAADEIKQVWQAPSSASKVKNPVASESLSIEKGKKVYTAKCLSCHGTQGKGDGPMLKVLKKKPGDLTDATVKAESDGALFWKITKGQKPMPSFAKNLTDQERWNSVNYIRALNQSAAGKK